MNAAAFFADLAKLMSVNEPHLRDQALVRQSPLLASHQAVNSISKSWRLHSAAAWSEPSLPLARSLNPVSEPPAPCGTAGSLVLVQTIEFKQFQAKVFVFSCPFMRFLDDPRGFQAKEL
jgi:hypothetical protein